MPRGRPGRCGSGGGGGEREGGEGWGGELSRVLLRLDRFFFFTSQSVSAVYKDYEIENVKKIMLQFHTAARREGEIWLDLSVRLTCV